jgi:hypothetical protein
VAEYGSLPFAEQIAFFKGKLNLPTERWDDILGAAHDRAFIVAGAQGADLLADLHAAVLKGIEQGATLETFRQDFDALVAKHGWTGWTGSDSAQGVAWRTQVIYETNLRTSYAAGRWAQIQDVKADRPYLQYRHNDAVLHPRPLHQSWDGLVLPADDPWWRTHYPPQGFGCKCRVFTLAAEDLVRLGKRGPDTAPDDGTYTVTRRGQTITLPKGIDYGWDHAPGATWHPDLDRYPYPIARDLVAANLRDGVFARWQERIAEAVADATARPALAGLSGKALSDRLRRDLATGERYALAVLDDRGAQSLGSNSRAVYLSDDTLIKQAVHREGQDLPAGAYPRVQRAIDGAEWVDDRGANRLVYFHADGDLLVAVIKVSADKQDNWLLSLRRGNQRELDAAIKAGRARKW